ncbi:hypothetical protein C0992_002307 [Termitomyces sp. T32_za158]|nr:hypothetical protein C0992_002307 [Termitomyces sp. T32_za158]
MSRHEIDSDVTSLASSVLPDIDNEAIESNSVPSQPQVPTEGYTMNSSKGSHWCPPHGMGLGSNPGSVLTANEMPDSSFTDYDDENVDYLLADGSDSEEEMEEFKPIPDNDENENLPESEKSQQKRASLPIWLNQNYADTRERLTSEIANNASRRPTCYDRGTFIDGPSAACFVTTKKFQPKPHDFYSPTYFIWLPHLLCSKIPCPACLADSRQAVKGGTQYLNVKGWSKRPRRVVDIEECIFIVGYCYICPNPACGKWYQSWNPEFISALPRSLSIQFTHHLTYRSGLTDRVVALLRSCFQHGMGPGPFSEMIRTHHLRRYEKLHVEYLEAILIRTESAAGHLLSKFDPFGSFDDRNGYAGFTPSPVYFRDFYVRFISSHATEMDQHMAMLSAEVLQIDHSYKVIRHLGKVSGETVFAGGLHTSVNEMGEIRSMVLTPSKSHVQFMPALKAISKSLEMYGHKPISAVMTDMPRIDKPELENTLPSLLTGVVPVPDIATLPKITVPNEWNVTQLSSRYQVNTRLNTIMDSLSENEDFYVAMDMEWSVDLENGIQGRVALISIAFEHEIFLLPLHCYWHDGGLPNVLLTFLRSPQIRKVGIKIGADLKRLFNDCKFKDKDSQPFTGAIELGKISKERNITKNAGVGLADLTSQVLQLFLPKDPSIRVSTAWDNSELSESQKSYAALDAYATWEVFRALSTISIGTAVTRATPIGTPVSLLSSDRSKIVAHGHVMPDQPKKLLGINVTKTRLVVTVTSILVPGHIVSGDLMPSKEDVPFSSFPEPPFNLVCKLKHLQTREESKSAPPLTQSSKPVLQSIIYSSDTTTSVAGPSNANSDDPTADHEHPQWYSDTDLFLESDQDPTSSFADETGIASYSTLLHVLSDSLNARASSSEIKRSGVYGDIWHLMNQFPISMQHGLRRPYARALRDAFFQYDPEDKAAVKLFLAEKGVSWESMVSYHSRWLFQRVKRFVPPPEELFPRVSQVVMGLL